MNAQRLLIVVLLPLASGLVAAPAERGTLVEPIETPRRVWTAARYPGWQAWNVADPYLFRDPPSGRYWLFYSGLGTSRLNAAIWEDWAIGRALSADGRAFETPEEYDPLVTGRPWLEGEVLAAEKLAASFDAVAAFAPCVLYANGRYALWYTGWNGDGELEADGRERLVHHRVGLATSRDGRVWSKVRGEAEAGAVLGLGAAGAPDAEGVRQPWVRRERNGYRMWYEGFDGRTSRILVATSSDGRVWQRAGVALDVGAAGAPDALGLAHPVVIERRGRLELWYQGLAAGPRPQRLLRAASTDGLHWTKLPGEIDLWKGRTPAIETQVGSVLVAANGACRVYFASPRELPAGRGGEARQGLEIFVATVNP